MYNKTIIKRAQLQLTGASGMIRKCRSLCMHNPFFQMFFDSKKQNRQISFSPFIVLCRKKGRVVGSMNRRGLARAIAHRTGLTQKDCEAVLSTLRPVIVESLLRDEKVSIAGLGIFSTRVRKSWVGKNPLTGEKMVVEAQKVPTFHPCKALHELEI